MSSPDQTHDQKWEEAQEGAELIREDRYDQAVDELERVLKEDATNEYAYYFLGCAHYEAQRYAQAMKAFLKALELKPTYDAALMSLGHTLRMMGQTSEAIRVGKQLLVRKPMDQDALYLLGMSHYSQGDQALARHYLQLFLNTHPELEAALEVEELLKTLPELNESGGEDALDDESIN